mmetsp:Transcript_9518/g.10522  ORF Transcript_9518/g.10522 Transcript_9518/m.10522 type:complete len:199 (+) Transcript_9518:33-629(+)
MGDGFIPDDVDDWLEEHPDFYATETCRVKCEVTDHEMPPRLDVIKQHFNGKKYKKMKKQANKGQFDYTEYEYIVLHPRDPTKLFCELTQTLLNKDEDAVKKHVNGGKYKKRAEQYENHKQKFEKQVEQVKKTKTLWREFKEDQKKDRQEEREETDKQDAIFSEQAVQHRSRRRKMVDKHDKEARNESKRRAHKRQRVR